MTTKAGSDESATVTMSSNSPPDAWFEGRWKQHKVSTFIKSEQTSTTDQPYAFFTTIKNSVTRPTIDDCRNSSDH
ncbi:unnamed protein product [Victoria cruziana]